MNNNTDTYPTPEEAVARIHKAGRWPTVYVHMRGCFRRNVTYATREDAERAAIAAWNHRREKGGAE